MRKGILFMLLCLISIIAVACGGGNAANGSDGDGGECAGEEETGGEETGGEETGGEDNGGGGDEAGGDDHWDRYVATYKEGRSWTYEMDGGVQSKTEVVSVTDDEATTKTTTIMNGEPMGEPQETKVPLTQTDTSGEGAEGEAPEWQEKEVEVKAGTFECVSTDGENWMMKKYPGIVVKSASMELTEFNE